MHEVADTARPVSLVPPAEDQGVTRPIMTLGTGHRSEDDHVFACTGGGAESTVIRA